MVADPSRARSWSKRAALAASGVAALLLVAPGPAAALVGQEVHPYDDKPHMTELCSNDYRDRYSCGVYVLCVPNYNYQGFPPAPESPRCVAWPPSGIGTIDVRTAEPFLALSGWCATGWPFFNPNGITITARGLVGTYRTTCKSNYGSGAHFSLACLDPCFSVEFRGEPNSYIWDHLVFTNTGL